MRHLSEMDTFLKVVSHKSFAMAARELRVSPGSVTRRVMLLEESLGVKLINRNTRKLSVTEAGVRYYDFAHRILAEIREEELEISQIGKELNGPLKVVVSKSFGTLHMGQAAADFVASYPKIRISLIVSDVSLRSLDPIETGFDLAIRLGEPADTRLMSQSVGTARWIACASPIYLKMEGEPKTPEELSRHNCIHHHIYMADGIWKFRDVRSVCSVKINGSATTNSVIVSRQMVLNDLAVALLPSYCISDDIKAGKLRHILKNYTLPSQTIRALYPPGGLMPAKTKLFIGFLKERFKALDI
jgi:DNA-binding transcriptional LysR family regulator